MNPLIQLAKEINQHPNQRKGLLTAFVRENEFPIIEEQRAIFFYWENEQTDDVYLIHWVYGLESRQQFQRIPHTNAFWLALDLPTASRVEYKLEVQRGGKSFWRRDPHNPQRAFDPFGSNSVCAMGDYQEPEWCQAKPHTRKGQLESFLLDNKAYGDSREIMVYLPYEYRHEKKYPLLICQDGRDYRRFASIVNVFDNLIHRREVLPLIVAFTDGVNRNPEYGANPQQAEFLVHDLLPAMEARHSIIPGPEKRGLMGASFGGVSSLYTAWKYPDVFHRLLIQSSSLVFTDIGEHGRSELWDPVVEFVNSLRKNPETINSKVYMSCGIFESLIAYNRSIAPLLRKAGVELRFVESQDGHNWINWRDRLREGLSYLFPGHLWMYYE